MTYRRPWHSYLYRRALPAMFAAIKRVPPCADIAPAGLRRGACFPASERAAELWYGAARSARWN